MPPNPWPHQLPSKPLPPAVSSSTPLTNLFIRVSQPLVLS